MHGVGAQGGGGQIFFRGGQGVDEPSLREGGYKNIFGGWTGGDRTFFGEGGQKNIVSFFLECARRARKFAHKNEKGAYPP